MSKRLAGLCFIAVCGFGFFQSSCGLLESAKGIKITLPTIEYHFDLNVEQILMQLEQKVFELTGMEVDLSGAEIPEQVCNPQGCVDIPIIQETFSIELPPQRVDLSHAEQLKNIYEGRLRAVEINYLNYILDFNSLNFDLPSIEIYMDGVEAELITENSARIAEVPATQAGQTGEGQLLFAPGGQKALSDYLLSLKFAMLTLAHFSIDTAVNNALPAGLLQGKIRVSMNFIVDPI